MLISRHSLTNGIDYVPHSGVVYVVNAKVACSTIKKSLWLWSDERSGSKTYSGNPHDRPSSPLCTNLEQIDRSGLDDFLESKFFTVVRNPYVRILSAYLDKVASRPRDAAVWFPFARRFRLAGDAQLSFNEFLRLVVTEDPSLLDPHFAPQYVNCFQGLIGCDFVGRLEEMERVQEFLAGVGVQVANHTPHVTKATELVERYYGKEEIDLVGGFYGRDFETYGYSLDPKVLPPISTVREPAVKRETLRLAIEAYTAANWESRRKCIEALRQQFPALITDYIALEAGVVDQGNLKRLADEAIRNKEGNWKFVARIGQELIRYDMINEAASVLQRAKSLLGEARPAVST